MTFRRHYKTSGARMVYGVDGGAPPQRSAFPQGTFTAVPCPDCPALVKEKCRSNTTGKQMAQVHISRRRIAIRKYNADQEARHDCVE